MRSSSEINNPEQKLSESEQQLDKIQDSLETQIAFIQNAYQLIWNDAKTGDKTTTFYQTAQICEQFKQYKNVQEIEQFFINLRKLWKDNAVKEKFNEEAAKAYLLSLGAMEAVVIDAFITKSRQAIQVLDVKQYLPEALVKIDSKKIISELIEEYEKTTLPAIFVKHETAFSQALKEGGVQKFIQDKKLYKDKFAKFLALKSIEESKDANNIEKCRQMINEEMNDAVLSKEHEQLLNEERSLKLRATEIHEENSPKIEEYIKSVKSEKIPKIDDEKNPMPAWEKLSTQIEQQQQSLTASIALIEKQNEVRLGYREATDALTQFVCEGDKQEYKEGWKDRVLKVFTKRFKGEKNILNYETLKKTQEIRFKNEKALQTFDFLKIVLDNIQKSMTAENVAESVSENIDCTLLKNKKIELEKTRSKVFADLQTSVTQQTLAFRDSAISSKRQELEKALKRLCHVKSVPGLGVLDARKKQQDEFWNRLEITEDNFSDFEKMKEDFLRRYQNSDDVWAKRASLLREKLDNYYIARREMLLSQAEQANSSVVVPEAKPAIVASVVDSAPAPISALELEQAPVIQESFFNKWGYWFFNMGVTFLIVCCLVVAILASAGIVPAVVGIVAASLFMVELVIGFAYDLYKHINKTYEPKEKPIALEEEPPQSQRRSGSYASMPFRLAPSPSQREVEPARGCFSRLFVRKPIETKLHQNPNGINLTR